VNHTPTKQAIVLTSGGIDSAACVHLLRTQSISTRGLFVDYGQVAADQERIAVNAQREFFGIDIAEVAVKHGLPHGAGEVPGRNLLLVSLAAAVSGGEACLIGMGVHAGTDYWDCGPEFVRMADDLIQKSTRHRTSLFAPFVDWRKADVFRYFFEAALPLSITYSCEAGVPNGCGNCRSCDDRAALS
jgi:7-cyano-7-deazaguanine synthase